MNRALLAVTVLSLVGLILLSGPAAPAQPPEAAPDWPMFIGPDGSRVPTVQGYELVDDLGTMRQTWKLERHTGVGKGLYPGTIRRCRELGIEPFYGGAANLIIADGKVFCSYYKPDGEHPAEPEGWRTMDSPEKLAPLPDWFFSVTADDILLAVDAETGELLWEAVEKGGGLNRLAHKRAHWVRSPAYANGRVFSMGSMGVLRAYDAETGKRLWETSTSPDLERARQEHIEAGKLYWGAEDQSSVIVADGVVVIARQRLSGYDADSGERLWQIDEPVMSKHGTPTIWTHDGRAYVLAHTGISGELRLVDPRTGEVLWTYTGLGPRLGTLSVEGDIVMVAFPSEKGITDSDGDPRQVLYGALRLGLDGAEKLWVMPDEPQNRFHWKHDKGPRYRTSPRDGLAYFAIAPDERPEGAPRARLIVAELDSGEILAEKPMNVSLGNPIPMENRLWVIHDYAHSNPISQSYWTAGRDPQELTGVVEMPHDSITGYYVDLEPIYHKGRVYFRGLEGLICYDLRKRDPQTSRTIRLEVPASLTGLRRDRTVRVYVSGGEITHGDLAGGGRIHDVDTSHLRLEGDRLTGGIGIGIYAGRHPEMYHLDARVSDGEVRGRMAIAEPAFSEPLELSGQIESMEHQPAWMPPATHTIVLTEAARNRPGEAGRLILLPTIRDGEIQHVAAWADHTTTSPPAVYYTGLRVRDGRLVGEVQVRYRPDKWTTPLVEHGETAGATYTIDADLDGQGRIGSYTGTYGTALERSAEITGTVR
ncbi:MAG: PQQ-binding-like beta-propeller repeat protein [Planctomycetota bacterium]